MAVVLGREMFDLYGSLVVYSIVFFKCNRLRRRFKRTDFTWIYYVPFVLAAAIILFVVPTIAPFVISFFEYWFRPAIYAARLVLTWRHSIFSLAVYIARLMIAYYPRFFWCTVSAVRRLFALAKLASSLLAAFVSSRR